MEESELASAEPPSATLTSMEAELEKFRVDSLAELHNTPAEESKKGHKICNIEIRKY